MLKLTTQNDDDEYTHNEATKGRVIKDNADEERLATSLKQHGVFQNDAKSL
jgi:hypothetical protein